MTLPHPRMPLSALPPPPLPNSRTELLLGLKTPEYDPFNRFPVGRELLFETGRLGVFGVSACCPDVPPVTAGAVRLASAVATRLNTLGVPIVGADLTSGV